MNPPDSIVEPVDVTPPRGPSAAHTRSVGEVLVVREPMSYPTAWELQSRCHAERVRSMRPDTLLILEHRPVYTLGRTAQPSHWGGDERILLEQGAELHRVNRGGSVTYHGPGQVVAYPILQLTRYATGPRQVIHLLEEVILQVLRTWNIDGHRIPTQPGIWVSVPGERKIASIGLRVEQGVTLHGFALNVDMDLTPFARIIPCGLKNCRVTSMSEVLQSPLSIESVKDEMVNAFAQVFPIEWIHVSGMHETAAARPFAV